MKIKPVDEPINFVMPDDVTEEAIKEQTTVTKNVNTSDTGVTVEEVLTPSGKEAISFVSPVSELKVTLIVPGTQEILNIERDIVRNHTNSGTFEQSIVFLSHLIVEYGDRKGEKLFNFDKLKQFNRKELMVINMIANEFFRLGEI
jgi:hypothetical protein